MNKRLMYLGLSLVALLLIASGFYRHYQNGDSSDPLTSSQTTSTTTTSLETTKTTETSPETTKTTGMSQETSKKSETTKTTGTSQETSKKSETTKTTERTSTSKTTSTSKEGSSAKKTSEDDEEASMSKADFLASIEPKNFRFTDQEDEMVDFVKDSKGKPAVVNIWATWCNPCRQEMPEFQKVWEEYQDDVNFYLVNALDSKPTETKEKVEDFLEELNFKMPIYYDYHLKTMAVANAVFFPTTLFIDSEGQVVHYQFGQMDQAAIEEQLQKLLKD
ncbi:TlpA family protein disulfide reductase [Facklamia hominis]|uniref:TlpA disulfide reductase family protein n=1 Tax=Facklamia hominis TaxID=178214 RepID=A0AAJ1Q4Q5_9LACT|nr:TlpA disulfide reductase family protein [Facklamia hominis]MDK7187627.1 TlpA disulfide reductase family protein [Facklamia hominis]